MIPQLHRLPRWSPIADRLVVPRSPSAFLHRWRHVGDRAPRSAAHHRGRRQHAPRPGSRHPTDGRGERSGRAARGASHPDFASQPVDLPQRLQSEARGRAWWNHRRDPRHVRKRRLHIMGAVEIFEACLPGQRPSTAAGLSSFEWQTATSSSSSATARLAGERIDRAHASGPGHLQVVASVIDRLHARRFRPRQQPFVGQEGARPDIWSDGHRTAQGLVIYSPALERHLAHRARTADAGDEVNIWTSGSNYG